MGSRDFIPGIWEEEVNVTDFINLNKRDWRGADFLVNQHELEIPKDYDVLLDVDKKFKYLVPTQNSSCYLGHKENIFLEEETYSRYIETGDRRKLIDTNLLILANKIERLSFLQPEIAAISLYGTRFIMRLLKQYIKDLDKQFQTQEWIQRKINHHRSLEALHNFEAFSEEHGINLKNESENAIEVANAIWLTALYAVLENPKISFSYYSILQVLDIFLEHDIKNKKLNEQEAQRLVDELYCKLAGLRYYVHPLEEFSFNVNIGSRQISKTTYRILNSAQTYKNNKLPFQIIFQGEEFPEDIRDMFSTLFNSGYSFSMSQSLRKRSATDLTVTPTHTFFRNYEDVTMQLASFDLERAFLVALNGGKDVQTNINLQPVTKALIPDKISFDTAFLQFEMFLKYYITLYTEYINAFAHYFDFYHNFSFRQALISSYPHYLLNIPYHNVTTVVHLLTAILEQRYNLDVDDKGFIKKIVPLTDNKEEFIGAKISSLIHEETKKMIFYKNGNYNVVFFAEAPFFEKEDKFSLSALSPITFLKTSFSGFQAVDSEQFKKMLRYFEDASYTHVRLHKN